jgi:hypothetical protein
MDDLFSFSKSSSSSSRGTASRLTVPRPAVTNPAMAPPQAAAAAAAATAAAAGNGSRGGGDGFVPVVGAYSEAAMDSMFSFSRGSGGSRTGSKSSTIRHPGM